MSDPAGCLAPGFGALVDEVGMPLVVYHATQEAPFDRFDLDRCGSRLTLPSSGLGIFFAPTDSVRFSYGRNVLRAHVRLDNPHVMRLDTLNRMRRADVAGFRAYLEGLGHDGIVVMLGKEPKEFVAFHPEQVHMLGWGRAAEQAPYAVEWAPSPRSEEPVADMTAPGRLGR